MYNMGKYTLPEMPYAYDALEPHIDARTMEIHHTKHHQKYTDGMNGALEKLSPELQSKDIVDIFRHIIIINKIIPTNYLSIEIWMIQVDSGINN